jgi:hypothetical protein
MIMLVFSFYMLQECVNFKLDLALDVHPQDTTWKVFDSDRAVVVEGGNYVLVNGTVAYEACLPGDGCYVFELFDSFGNGSKCLSVDSFFVI